MKKIILFLVLFMSLSLKAQQMKPMYPEDRTLSCATGLCASGISYPIIYSLLNSRGYNKRIHLKTVLLTSAISVGASLLSSNYGKDNSFINRRQNLTASLISSTFTITLVRIGIGN